jgi:hypothetical protein
MQEHHRGASGVGYGTVSRDGASASAEAAV